ncbi:SDR family oxidoreductase [Bradyrhizobium sp. 14AA]
MASRLIGKVAVVFGAGSSGPGWGNGKAAAVAFASEGARIVCADLSRDAAEETTRLIRDQGLEAHALQCDASREEDVRNVVAFASQKCGRIDVLHNNVGVARTGGILDLAEAEWDRDFAVNVKSAIFSMKAVIPLMKRQGGGAIINVSSIASQRYTGVPYISYNATKAALNQLTRATAVQYAPDNIRINAILPGLMRTPMVEHYPGLAARYGAKDIEAMWMERDRQVPLKRTGDAWDVAWAAVYLASDEAKYVTGLEMVVDGGLTLKCS